MNSHDPKSAAPASDSVTANDDATVARIRELIARSSLGTPGAVELRDRTSPEMSSLVRQLGDLRNRLAHRPPFLPLTHQDIIDLMWVADQCEWMGLHETARWAFGEVAAANIERIARSFDTEGESAAAKTWRARADTLHLGEKSS